MQIWTRGAGQKERSDVYQHRFSGQVLENRLVVIPAADMYV